MQRNPFGTCDNSVPVADCSLVEERAAFEALFPRGRAVRDTLVGLRIALCTGGAAQIEVDGRRYDFREGGVLCLTPSRLVRVVSLSAGFRLRMLSFTFDFLAGQPFLLRASVSEAMERTPCIEPDDEARRSLTGLFDFLRMQLGRDAFPSRREAVEALLFILIAEASHLYDREPVSLRRTRAEEIADGFFALLHRHFRREHSLAFYAAGLCITEKYLIRTIGRTTGHTPAYWIAGFRLREANVLLRSTDLSVTEISELLGFASPSLFARFYRRLSGSSPLEARKAARCPPQEPLFSPPAFGYPDFFVYL